MIDSISSLYVAGYYLLKLKKAVGMDKKIVVKHI